MSGTPPTPPWTEAPGASGGESAETTDADGPVGPDDPGRPDDPASPAERVRRADGLLVLADFDGTLADVRPRPDRARIRPASRGALASLADRPRTAVAVVSGRALADVRERVGLDGIGYAGNHGLEIETPDRQFVHPDAAEADSLVAAVCADLRGRLADVDGVVVEEKTLSATVHYRRVAQETVGRVREAVRESVASYADRSGDRGAKTAAGGLRVEEGKQIVEVKPDVDWDKGRAVEWLRDVLVPDGESWHPVYVGDDVTDEDAFRALAGAGTTVRVGSGDEPTAADYRVDGPGDVPSLLAWFAAVGERGDGGAT